MSRYIDADAMKKWIDEYVSVFKKSDNKDIKGYIEHQPTIEVVPKDFHDKTCEAMAKAHQEEIADILERADADRPQGEWVEKTKFHNADDDPIIEEWQSAKCSVCGKYHTTPYLYYFDDYNFCPNCGARMKGADDGRNAD